MGPGGLLEGVIRPVLKPWIRHETLTMATRPCRGVGLVCRKAVNNAEKGVVVGSLELKSSK